MLRTLTSLLFLTAVASAQLQFSGIYPHLVLTNKEGECGTGAVVPWADRLWVITYGPHLPKGSSDKLYEITSDLQKNVRPESIGGTPANRMIHEESQQLFIGPYIIDAKRNVRTIPYSTMFGRHTGLARHLTDPANKIVYATMEEGIYEVDVKTLAAWRDVFAQQNRASIAEHREVRILVSRVSLRERQRLGRPFIACKQRGVIERVRIESQRLRQRTIEHDHLRLPHRRGIYTHMKRSRKPRIRVIEPPSERPW